VLVFFTYTCRLISIPHLYLFHPGKMAGLTKIALLVLVAGITMAAAQRAGKNLRNTFPFNNNRNNRGGARAQRQRAPAAHEDHHHHEHHEAHATQEFAAPRDSRIAAGQDLDLSIGNIAAAGERCIDKVVMVEETEYDDQVECKHSYSEKCHTSYTTDFEPQQEEECEENFKKSCFIEYKKVASQEPVQFCHTPLICDGEGPTECRTVYESECETKYIQHDVEDDDVTCETTYEERCDDVTNGYTTEQKCDKWPVVKCTDNGPKRVTKHTPQTSCTKKPHEICGPVGCELKEGPQECYDRTETVVQEVPEETCNLEPQKTCKHVTKLVPFLKEAQECVDIPKEVCSRSRTNPRKVQKPVVKKWCYVPTAASGLA